MSNDISLLPEWSKPWATKRLAAHGQPIAHARWTGLRDWLVALPVERPKMVGKLHKLTLADALAATERWHGAMAARSERLMRQRKGFGGDPDAVASVSCASDSGWRWVRVLTPEGMDYEGEAMGHCAGRGGYDDQVVYSLRDPDNLPHCTIHWQPETRTIGEIQGRANQSVSPRYVDVVEAFVLGLEPEVIHCAGNISRVAIGGRLLRLEDLVEGQFIRGDLDLTGFHEVLNLPIGLHIERDLIVRGITGRIVFPDSLRVGETFELEKCSGSISFGAELDIGGMFNIEGCDGIEKIAANTRISGSFFITNCRRLQGIGDNLTVDGTMEINDCLLLSELAPDTTVESLALFRCPSIRQLPALDIPGSLVIEKCDNLRKFGDHLRVGRNIEIKHSPLEDWPEDLSVGGHIYGIDIPRRAYRR